MKKGLLLLLTLVLLGSLLSACAGQGDATGERTDSKSQNQSQASPPMPTEPVHLTFFMGGAITDEEFSTLIADPIANKYPNITVERVRGALEDMIASNSIPDVIGVSPWAWLTRLQALGLVSDLNPLIKKYNIDLAQFNPDIVKYLKALGPNGEMYALPHHINSYALYYNKDIFDKFGAQYPRNGMTWPQVIDLAAKVSRSDGGEQYKGLDINRIHNFGSPYSLPYVDVKTNKAYIPDKWKEIFDLAMRIYNIPGNKPKNSRQTQLVIGDPNSKLAMTPGYTEAIYRLLDSQRKTGMKWGVVQYPSFTDLPNTNKQLVVESFMFPAGKNQEVAFRASLPLISDEVQLQNAKNAMVSALKDPKYTKEFGANIPELKDQDLSGLFLGKYAAPAPVSKYDDIVTAELFTAIDNAINGTDINTALRAAKENADAKIAAAQQ
jgi:multiple sugar transport system substrate-binding protein